MGMKLNYGCFCKKPYTQERKKKDKKMHDMTPLNQLKVHPFHEVTGPQQSSSGLTALAETVCQDPSSQSEESDQDRNGSTRQPALHRSRHTQPARAVTPQRRRTVSSLLKWLYFYLSKTSSLWHNQPLTLKTTDKAFFSSLIVWINLGFKDHCPLTGLIQMQPCLINMANILLYSTYMNSE